MKRLLFILVAGTAVGGLAGCHNYQSCPNGCPPRPMLAIGHGNPDDPNGVHAGVCQHCGGRGCPFCGGGLHQTPGPVTGAVTYPYYTLRGPRDYFANNPPSIGP